MRPLPFLAILLLAGCLMEEGPFPDHQETKSTEQPNFDNLVVSATLSGGGDEVRVSAIAHNQGPHTYKVSAICTSPWTDGLTGRFGPVHRHEPMAVCAAFGLRDFKPGERIPYGARWNGTLWDEQARRHEAAPPGRYTWQFAFEAYKGGSGSDFETRDYMRIPFDVTVRG